MAIANNKINQFDRAINVTIEDPSRILAVVHVSASGNKELQQIHFSVRQGTSGIPPANDEFAWWIRIFVFSKIGNLESTAIAANLITPLDTTLPSEFLGGSEIGDVGIVRYDQVHIWPYSNNVIFRQPMLFDSSEDIVVMASYPVPQGAASGNPVENSIIHLSARGRIIR